MVTQTGGRRIANYELVATDCRKDALDVEVVVDPRLSRIVWKFDREAAIQEGWRREGLGEYPCETASLRLTARNSTEQAVSENGTTTTALGIDQSEDSLQPADSTRGRQGQTSTPYFYAFAQGTRVEYYSKTHCKWLAGTIEGPSVVEDDHGLLRYQVMVGMGVRKQLRAAVEPELLRLPFHASAPVSVYLEQAEQWVAARVTNKQPISAAMLGYQVHVIEGKAEGFDFSVPADSVMPRFPEGYAAEVFLSSSGWVPCTVLAQVSTHQVEATGALWFEVDVQPDRLGHSLRMPSYRVRCSRRRIVQI